MRAAAALARIGNQILSMAAAILILAMLLYGGYSLWDTAMISGGAFVSSDLLRYKPSMEEEGHPTLAELQGVNPDVRGWLTMEDTHIDYPVVQGKTDMEYINKDVYGEFALSGSIFLDSRNSGDFSDSYSLVYGHHMANGAMFGDIVDYVDEEYFSERREGWLFLTEGDTYRIRVFACVETDAYDPMIYQPDGWGEENLATLLSYVRTKATRYEEIGVTSGDRIIGLSTCAEAETNGRVIVFGRLEREEQVQEGDA